MQIFGLHKNIYKLAGYACKQENIEKYATTRFHLLKNWELLKSKGLSDTEISRVVGFSRATYYRRRKILDTLGVQGLNARSKRPKRLRQSLIPSSTKQRILTIRRDNPTYGKKKIIIILKREDIHLSESTVGRILLVFRNKGLVSTYQAARKKRKKRYFHGHAKRWSSDLKAKNAGEMIQIDHMSVTKNQMHFKHFQAWDPKTKMIVAQCFSQASSSCAAKFLETVIQRLPFPVRSIQVDGGSEFMKHFEQACADKTIPLYVLPPKSPKLNGGVERANRTFREDFYARPSLANSIHDIRVDLEVSVHKYNTFRPHERLGGKTPFEYTCEILQANSQSHML